MMRIVSWNMGCGPRTRYRRTHDEAWRYLIGQLCPDVAFVQEALLQTKISEDEGRLIWSTDRGRDSGTALFVRAGLNAEPIALRAAGSYVAAGSIVVDGAPTLVASIHVGPPNYRAHLATLADTLSIAVTEQRFVVGGDLNAARHLDDVYGGRWFTRYFEDLHRRQLFDCHWAQHGKEVQTFWGHQAKEKYQCDHLFTDETTAMAVKDCSVIDNAIVRTLSDHAPLELLLTL